MEALQKEPLSSDSEDEDYVPPPEVKQPTLSLRKRSGGLELESDDDDEDDLSDDADLVDAEVAQLYAADHAGSSNAGAGPSSAGAGPSTAGAATSSAGAGPSSAAAGPSAAGAGPSSAGAASSAAGPSSAAAGVVSGLNAGAGSSAGASSAAASSVAAAGTSAAAAVSAGAGVSVKPASKAIADGLISVVSDVTTGGAEGTSAAKPGQAAAAGENGAPSAKAEEPIAKKPRVETEEKKSIDDIWADMNAGVTRAKEPTTTADAGLSAWLESTPAPKKQFKVTRLSELEKSVRREEPLVKKKGRTGLEGVLDVVRGKSERVIEKTKEQWKEFKKDEDVHDELEKYKKDKDRYTDKVAFLQRSDVREWEYEQRGRKRR